jgi:hypothetical protein
MTDLPEELGILLGEPVELVALAVKQSAIRCRTLHTGIPVTFRKVRWWVEGEILTVRPEKLWRFKNTNYMSGKVASTRIDIPALKLEPLRLNEPWPWDSEEEYWGEEPCPTDRYFAAIKLSGCRTSYEMEQILPFEDPEDPFDDPISIANELIQSGREDEAYQMMKELLVEDLRCLDAHAHLGTWDFSCALSSESFSMMTAIKHFEVGVRIGELSLPADENIVLPWGRIDNRPFLRCLKGYALSLWRMGEVEAARRELERLLWLNPPDNQGARFNLLDIDEGRSWEESRD